LQGPSARATLFGVNVHTDRPRPTAVATKFGEEGQMLVSVDDFAPDPDALRAAAMTARFGAADQHYPGVRAALPGGYMQQQMPLIARLIGRHLGSCRQVRVVDASFSIVTTAPGQLSVPQRLPHVDAYGAERIAMVHYLSPEGGDGTAFFRHRATGFETITAERAPAYTAALDAELAKAPPPPAYVAGDTPQFSCIARAEARFNRALLYRSWSLHSGAIAPDAALSADPSVGRLTITGFFAIA
jgi:hypothetical protein